MPHISLRVTEREKRLMESYASLHSLKLSDVLKNTFFEKLEDEYDLKAIENYQSQSERETYTHEQVGQMLGLKERV